MKEEERKKLFEKYKKEIGFLVERVNDDAKNVVEMLIDRICYLSMHLEEIEQETVKKGLLSKGKNSTGSMITKINPLVNAYVGYIKQFTSSLKQLQSFLENLTVEEKDELQQFASKFKR